MYVCMYVASEIVEKNFLCVVVVWSKIDGEWFPKW